MTWPWKKREKPEPEYVWPLRRTLEQQVERAWYRDNRDRLPSVFNVPPAARTEIGDYIAQRMGLPPNVNPLQYLNAHYSTALSGPSNVDFERSVRKAMDPEGP